MPRSRLIVILSCGCIAAGCNAIAKVAGAPKIVSVTITAPAGLLVGDSAIATAVAMADDGRERPGWQKHWSSSDPAALSIDANGKMIALSGGRTVTIRCEVEGTNGTAAIVIVSDDARFGYALADQPAAAGPYVPASASSFNSSNGTIEVTRSAVGAYSVRFAGLGRQPGQRDNVQVSAVSGEPTYCKPDVWSSITADLVVPVACYDSQGDPADTRFTVMVLGSQALGKSATLGFASYRPSTTPVVLDTTATARNSTGGYVVGVRDAEGSFGVQFEGLGPAWLAAPAAIQVTEVGPDLQRCRTTAYDKATASLHIVCTGLGGGARDAPWSVLWLQHGRPGMRFGFAWATNAAATADYTPFADFLINSSGGSAKARKTGLGQYRVVFAGLGRPTGATETIFVSSLFTPDDRLCDVVSWGNTGVSDLFVDVGCYDPTGAAVDSRFGVMVIQ